MKIEKSHKISKKNNNNFYYYDNVNNCCDSGERNKDIILDVNDVIVNERYDATLIVNEINQNLKLIGKVKNGLLAIRNKLNKETYELTNQQARYDQVSDSCRNMHIKDRAVIKHNYNNCCICKCKIDWFESEHTQACEASVHNDKCVYYNDCVYNNEYIYSNECICNNNEFKNTENFDYNKDSNISLEESISSKLKNIKHNLKNNNNLLIDIQK